MIQVKKVLIRVIIFMHKLIVPNNESSQEKINVETTRHDQMENVKFSIVNRVYHHFLKVVFDS